MSTGTETGEGPPPRGSIVCNAVMRCPEGPPLYWAKLRSIHQNALLKEAWAARIDFAEMRLANAITLKDSKAAKAYGGTVKQAAKRVTRRDANVGRQLEEPIRPFFVEKDGVKLVKNWAFDRSNGGKGDEIRFEGRHCLHLVATEKSAPSWRLKVKLEPGRYRLSALLGVRGVEATADEHGRGVGIHIAGAPKTTYITASKATAASTPGPSAGNR